jgi:hypothetical protein
MRLSSFAFRIVLAASLSACAWISGLTTYEQCPDDCFGGDGAPRDAGADGTSRPPPDAAVDADAATSFACGAAPCGNNESCCLPADAALSCSPTRGCASPAITINCIDDRNCAAPRRCCASYNAAEGRITTVACLESDTCDFELCKVGEGCADAASRCEPLGPGAPAVCR